MRGRHAIAAGLADFSHRFEVFIRREVYTHTRRRWALFSFPSFGRRRYEADDRSLPHLGGCASSSLRSFCPTRVNGCISEYTVTSAWLLRPWIVDPSRLAISSHIPSQQGVSLAVFFFGAIMLFPGEYGARWNI